MFEKEKITGKVVASGIFLLSPACVCGATLHWCEHPWRCLVEGLGHAEGEEPKVERENVKKEKYSNLNYIGSDGISFGQRLLFFFCK